jgi:hypothetical protein
MLRSLSYAGLEVRVHNLGGRNYKFAVLKLHSEIDPKASSYKVLPSPLRWMSCEAFF